LQENVGSPSLCGYPNLRYSGITKSSRKDTVPT
jgi:hypothetical protein